MSLVNLTQKTQMSQALDIVFFFTIFHECYMFILIYELEIFYHFIEFC